MALTIRDLEQLQSQLVSQFNHDCRLELVDGEIIVMSPSGYESDEVAARVIGNSSPIQR